MKFVLSFAVVLSASIVFAQDSSSSGGSGTVGSASMASLHAYKCTTVRMTSERPARTTTVYAASAETATALFLSTNYVFNDLDQLFYVKGVCNHPEGAGEYAKVCAIKDVVCN